MYHSESQRERDETLKYGKFEEGLIKGLLTKVWVGCKGCAVPRLSKAELATSAHPGQRDEGKGLFLEGRGESTETGLPSEAASAK